MRGAEEILVIILSTTLAVFLTLGIMALIKVNQILDHLKRISEKAERLATTAENIGEFFKFSAGPAAIGKLLSNINEAVFKNRGSKKAGKNG